MITTPTIKSRVFEVVNQIPFGKLSTNSTVGKLTGINPRVVGWILTGMTESEMNKFAWQRVVAKNGIISTLKLGPRGLLHVQLLQKEGFTIRDNQILNFQDALKTRLLSSNNSTLDLF